MKTRQNLEVINVYDAQIELHVLQSKVSQFERELAQLKSEINETKQENVDLKMKVQTLEMSLNEIKTFMIKFSDKQDVRFDQVLTAILKSSDQGLKEAEKDANFVRKMSWKLALMVCAMGGSVGTIVWFILQKM